MVQGLPSLERLPLLVVHLEHRQLEIQIKIARNNPRFMMVTQGDRESKNNMGLQRTENMAVVEKQLFGFLNTQFVKIFDNDYQPFFVDIRQLALNLTDQVVAVANKIR